MLQNENHNHFTDADGDFSILNRSAKRQPLKAVKSPADVSQPAPEVQMPKDAAAVSNVRRDAAVKKKNKTAVSVGLIFTAGKGVRILPLIIIIPYTALNRNIFRFKIRRVHIYVAK